MKIAYGTYAMPTTPLEEAIPTLSGMGYDGIEIAISPRHVGSLPEQIDAARRANLRRLLRENEMGVPALFALGHTLEPDEEAHRQSLERMRRVAQLARDLGVADPPVIAQGIGGRTAQWEQVRGQIVRQLRDHDRVAREEGYILAIEPHCNAAVDRSERALWVIHEVDSPHVRLHFDIVHMFLAGEREADSVAALVPVTAHTHITDARRHEDGTFDLVLIGQGDLDTVSYLRAMHRAGWTGHITLEVSVRVWGQEGYDPIAAARQCYATLDGAFQEAGVPRSPGIG